VTAAGPGGPRRAPGSEPGAGRRQRLGARGEQLVADWYVARGYRVVARNWRCREGEIDLVLWSRRGDLVFCEVKTRSSTRFGVPAEAVTPAKQRRLRILAARFLAVHGPEVAGRRGLRFDVAAVIAGRVEVIAAAF
jgi:putative endonuclease